MPPMKIIEGILEVAVQVMYLLRFARHNQS
nr:MAG TPA: hypothetical protein [Caudoviricetes sp.]